MILSPRRRVAAMALLFAACGPTAARGDVFRDVAFGLGYAGFNIQGARNHLSGGADFLINNNFVGNALDFGPWDLTLQGPISLQVSTGGRQLSQFNISLTTALNRDGLAEPLGYALNYDVGAQSTKVSGTLLLDADLSLNGFGFYDLQLTYSSRQDVERDGRFTAADSTHDFDVGPINISGNIFADALAMLTAPLFEQAGQANPFDSFSGRAQLTEVLRASASQTQSLLVSGDDPGDTSLTMMNFGPVGGPLNAVNNPLPAGNTFGSIARGTPGAPVPEPATLVLMLLALPAVLLRR